MGAGTDRYEVEVRLRYDGRWVGGFDLVGACDAAEGDRRFLIRRRSDGAVLPQPFAADELRGPSGLGSPPGAP